MMLASTKKEICKNQHAKARKDLIFLKREKNLLVVYYERKSIVGYADEAVGRR